MDEPVRATNREWPRYVAMGLGLVFGVGAVWKAVAWPATVEGMQVYTVLRFVPAVVPAAASMLLELGVAFTLLHEKYWHRIGLPASALFLIATSGILAWQVTAGGGADCGCLPFLPRRISWLAVGQNLCAATFLIGIWGLAASEVKGTAVADTQPTSA